MKQKKQKIILVPLKKKIKLEKSLIKQNINQPVDFNLTNFKNNNIL